MNDDFDQQLANAAEMATAQKALIAIEELKKCPRGYAYLKERLKEKGEEFRNKAIDGDTAEIREANRLAYQIFKNEIIDMIDIDEANHLKTIGAERLD